MAELHKHLKGIIMKNKLASLAFLALTSVSSLASAVTFAPVVSLQTTEQVTVEESFDASAGKGYYSVTNNLSESITFFAVSAYNAHGAATTRDYTNTNPPSLFDAMTVTEAAWGSTAFMYSDLSLEAYFGAFDDVFGTEDNVANIYFEIDGFGIHSGEITGNQFSYLASLPASNWIALTDFGAGYKGAATLVGGPAAVPVPAAALLFTPALLGFVALRRKAQKAA